MSDQGGLSDDELERLAHSPIAQLALACRDVTDAAETIRENDVLWDQLVDETNRRSSRVQADDTVEDVILGFLAALDHYGGLARPEDGDGVDGDDA
jgi:hypothetical protein